jgi:hypothetical protein
VLIASRCRPRRSARKKALALKVIPAGDGTSTIALSGTGSVTYTYRNVTASIAPVIRHSSATSRRRSWPGWCARGAPAELMARYAKQDANRDRNDPRTCSSGRKWKRCWLCHGNGPQQSQQHVEERLAP